MSRRVHVATLVGVLVFLVFLNRGQWFFADEWDFIVRRGLHDPVWSIWRPHNEHWSTWPILAWRATFSLFGLKSYWPYLLPLLCAHALVMHLLWRLLRRAAVAEPIAAGLCLLFGLFGAGSENVTWAFQLGFVASLAAGLLLVLAVDGPPERRRVALVATGAVLSLGLSGISVVMTGAVALAAFGRWGWRQAVAVTAPAAVVYLVWLQFSGSVGLEAGTAQYHGELRDLPGYVWTGLTRTLGAPVRSPIVGGVLVVLLLVLAARRGRAWWPQHAGAVALAVAAPTLLAVISQGRGGAQPADSGRYLYLVLALLTPLAGIALTAVLARHRLIAPAVAVACVAAALGGASLLHKNAQLERTRELALQGQILAAPGIAMREAIVNVHPDYRYATELTVDQVAALMRSGKLPDWQSTTVVGRTAARLALEVAVAPRPGEVGGVVGTVSAPGTFRPAGACAEVDAGGGLLVVSVPRGKGRFSLTPARTGTLNLYTLYRGGAAGPRTLAVRAGERIDIVTTVRGRLGLGVPAGTNRFCGVTWQTK